MPKTSPFATALFLAVAACHGEAAIASPMPAVIVEPLDQQTKATVTRARQSVDIVVYDLGAQDVLRALQAARTRLARTGRLRPRSASWSIRNGSAPRPLPSRLRTGR
jgi:hypothetical protein